MLEELWYTSIGVAGAKGLVAATILIAPDGTEPPTTLNA